MAKQEKPGDLINCPACGGAVVVGKYDDHYEPVGFTRERVEQVARGAYLLGREAGTPNVGYPPVAELGRNRELDEYIEGQLQDPIQRATDRALES